MDFQNPDDWRRLNPDLAPATERAPAPAGLAEQIRQEGWADTGPILDVRPLRTAIENLVRAELLPVFAFVYDAFWLVPRAPSVKGLLSSLLGPDYKQKPNLWAHYVEPAMAASGWPPHVDLAGSDDLSLWFALSDATLDNGCMYVLPSFTNPENLLGALQSIRALPAEAGSVLGWRQRLLHWGSYSSPRAREPRVSLALEFQRNGPGEDLIDPQGPLPDHAARLRLIAKAILKYLEAFEPGRCDPKWIEWALSASQL